MRFIKLLFLISYITLCLASCSQDPAAIYPTFKNYDVPSSTKKIVLLHPYSYQQTTSYTCGPAVIMNLLHYYGKLKNSEMNKTTEMRLAREMGTTTSGTSQQNMVAWLEAHGFNVDYGMNVSTDTLIYNLNHNIPTIIVWNDYSGHAMLVIGYVEANQTEDGNSTMFIADPSSTSSIDEHHQHIAGINTLTQKELQLNWFNAKYFFNPSHTQTGMYIVAVPK